mmetsp:Transcript_6550/g.5877  ORF Transcript_6550/g.5877 Transcript_6550/m.5877 type:complete len:165 (+) Transcript_6550:76-570(+)
MIKLTICLSFILLTLSHPLSISSFVNEDPSETHLQDMYKYFIKRAPHHVQDTPERFEIFKSNVLSAVSHNRDPNSSWKATINMYSGLTSEELVGTKLMAPQTCSASTDDALKAYAADGSILPSSFDWRKMNIVTSPKDQKECASSWAFAAAGALESHWSLYSKT